MQRLDLDKNSFRYMCRRFPPPSPARRTSIVSDSHSSPCTDRRPPTCAATAASPARVEEAGREASRPGAAAGLGIAPPRCRRRPDRVARGGGQAVDGRPDGVRPGESDGRATTDMRHACGRRACGGGQEERCRRAGARRPRAACDGERRMGAGRGSAWRRAGSGRDAREQIEMREA